VTPGGWVTPKNLYFRGFRAQKTILSYSFDRIVLIFGYDVINDVISGFAKVVAQRCGFHHWIAQRISLGDVVSVFRYLL